MYWETCCDELGIHSYAVYAMIIYYTNPFRESCLWNQRHSVCFSPGTGCDKILASAPGHGSSVLSFVFLNCLTGAKRREWMGCWGLLGFLSTVSQWIIPSDSLAQVSYSKLGKAQHGRRKANVEKMAMFHAFEAHRMIGIQDWCNSETAKTGKLWEVNLC